MGNLKIECRMNNELSEKTAFYIFNILKKQGAKNIVMKETPSE